MKLLVDIDTVEVSLILAIATCESEDRSIEYTIQYASDAIRGQVAEDDIHDCVMYYLEHNELKGIV